ncbi:hypothetical protein BDQ17DRAFT_1368372 [Cyathus striatus]|nr:hypothetical protein BDQ17DRAFT_1368372 [Cyathus striatus]
MYLLEHNQFISVNYATIHCELLQSGISFKTLKCIAKECNEPRHAAFIAKMAQYTVLTESIQHPSQCITYCNFWHVR